MELRRKENCNKPLLLKNDNELYYLQFQAFNDTGLVKHLFTTRMGGVSKGELSSLNLSYSRGDNKENVDENFRRVANILGCTTEQFVLSQQTHTTNILTVTKKDCGKGITKEMDYKDIDGLITNEKGVVLATFFADCVPLFFLDPKEKVIALSHSGWRGTVNKMGKRTIDLMCREYGSKRENIITAIGPSICRDCYEVGKEVAGEFMTNFSGDIIDKIVFAKGNDKFLLDLWQANYEIMIEAGIKPDNISVTDICTSCNSDILFSHRASHGKRGNLGAFMVLT